MWFGLHNATLCYNERGYERSAFEGKYWRNKAVRQKIVRRIGRCILVVCMMAGIGWILLALVYLLPTAPMKVHAEKAVKVMEEQGSHYECIPGQKATALDNYTDAIMLNTAVYDGQDSVWRESAGAYRYGWQDKTEMKAFFSYMRDEEGGERVSYARYWNGYLVVLKPLLLIASYPEIKKINIVAYIVLTAAVVGAMIKRRCGQYIAAFILGCWFLMPFVNVQSLQYSQMYYVTMFLLLIFLTKYTWIQKKGYLGEFFTVAGCLTCFFDFLTYPLVPLGFLMIFRLILEQDNLHGIRDVVIDLLWNGVCWAIGYIGIWGMKWCIGSVVLGQNILGDALGQILYRTAAIDANSGQTVAISRFGALWENIAMLYNPVLLAAVLLFAVMILVRLVQKKGKISVIQEPFFWGMLLLMLLPNVWLMLKANHSHIHVWMTYRELATAVFALAAAWINITTKREYG